MLAFFDALDSFVNLLPEHLFILGVVLPLDLVQDGLGLTRGHHHTVQFVTHVLRLDHRKLVGSGVMVLIVKLLLGQSLSRRGFLVWLVEIEVIELLISASSTLHQLYMLSLPVNELVKRGGHAATLLQAKLFAALLMILPHFRLALVFQFPDNAASLLLCGSATALSIHRVHHR